MTPVNRTSNFPVAEQFLSAAAPDRDHDVILLSGRDLCDLLEPAAVIEALHETYRQLASNRQDQGKSLGFAIEGGSAHVKAGLLPGQRSVLAAKINVNLPDNWVRRRLPTIQGAVLLSDAVTGRPLAVMDSMTLTAIRTAATALLAARFGARKDSKVAAVIGCGLQARYQVDALLASYELDEIRVFDIDSARAAAFAEAVGTLGATARPAASAAEAASGADICITCTTAKSPVLLGSMDLAGCFVAAMGADNPEKNEIAPALMARARIIADDIEACAAGGDLAHALKAGALALNDVCADLCALASGEKAARTGADDLVIFDSTGSGVQDVATAWLAYQRARANGAGQRFSLEG